MPTPCLDEDTIVAFIAARLQPEQIGRVEAHVHECANCGELLTMALAAGHRRTKAAPDGGPDGKPAAATLARGSAFGRYTVLGPIGQGAMGEVYAAYDPDLDRKVALKILHAVGDGADERKRSRLLREAKAIAKLRHPNVILVHEAGTLDGRVFLAMEYVDGQTLASWLGERARTRHEIIAAFAAAGRGLGAAHAAGIAHRDFKPQNVMVDREGGVRVTDFGLAREIGATEPTVAPPAASPDVPMAVVDARTQALPLTRTGELVGTPLYMPPEGFKTQRADARSDQFSFCVALYQALYGTHPFGGRNLGELMAAVTAGRILPPPPKSSVPPWLRRVLVRGLSVDPAARWPSMDALTAALLRDPARDRRRWVAGGASATLLIAAFAFTRMSGGKESVCRRGPERLLGVWEPQGVTGAATRRAATRAAFEKTGVERAGDAWDRAAAMLDRYTRGWLGMYQETCAATHERGEQSVEVLDLRMACLTERLGRIKALTDVFADANATVVDNAVQAAGALPALDRCADVALLKAVVPPPDNPATRARVDQLRHELARVMALHDSGQCAAASKSKEKLIVDADQLGYLPLQAVILASLSRTECLSSEQKLQICKRAALIGLASHEDEAAIEGTICVALSRAEFTPDLASARDWLDLATAMKERVRGSYPVLESWRLLALARVYQKEGQNDRALDTLGRARTLIAQTQGPEHLDYAKALGNTGVTLGELGRFDEASSYQQRAAELAFRLKGPNNTVSALALVNNAEVLNALGRYAGAQAAAEQALGIYRRMGSPPFYEGFALTTLGQALLGQTRPREAATQLEEAVDLLRDGESGYAPTARFALARALWSSSPESRPRAMALAREARAGYERFNYEAQDVAKVDAWLREHASARAR
jgi:tRNA A-37 threonylcarbamoyl transferase component Bud32/tetratricopeptide (TPR) repeat protein